MFGFLKRADKTLPPELVEAIKSANVGFRGGKHFEDGPRPLMWGFLEGRPIYADEREKLERRLLRHFETLTPEQVRRAISLIQARVSETARRDATADRLDGKPRKNWVNSWGGQQPWEL